MTELRFKLKKDGKCVGYMRICLEPNHRLRMEQEFRHPWSAEWLPRNIADLLPEADSIHPFVRQDRNGQDVYEGDAIRAFYPCGKVIDEGTVAIPRTGVFMRAQHNSGAVEPNRIELLPDAARAEKGQ
jgi:hypothetical protein